MITIRLSTDNAAFRNDDGSVNHFAIETVVKQAQDKLIDMLANRQEDQRIFDSNGNTIGHICIRL